MFKSRLRRLAEILIVLLLTPAFPSTALASGGGYAEGSLPEPAAEPGGPLSEETDTVTRDLLYDKATNKQFITIQDRDGNFFYIVIDYDAPVGGEEEQFKTYFLNPVDAADLAALAREGEDKPAACTCAEKCVPGNINMGCPVCASNMTECMGKEPEKPEPAPEPPPAPAVMQEPEKKPGVNPAVPAIALLALAGGGVFAFVKFKKGSKKSNTPNPDDYEDEDDLLYETEDETEAENDTEEAANETGGTEESGDETE